MIASLRGQVIDKGKDFVIVEVNGVGFRVTVPRPLLALLDGTRQEVELHTHLHVRENELALFGAATREELDLFRLLLGVAGIGPKVAISILSELSPEALRQAVVNEDATSLSHVPGVGPKTARNVIFHLRDKMVVEEVAALGAPRDRTWESELVSTLTALGYSASEARAAIAALPDEELEFEERLRLALRYFAR